MCSECVLAFACPSRDQFLALTAPEPSDNLEVKPEVRGKGKAAPKSTKTSGSKTTPGSKTASKRVSVTQLPHSAPRVDHQVDQMEEQS